MSFPEYDEAHNQFYQTLCQYPESRVTFDRLDAWVGVGVGVWVIKYTARPHTGRLESNGPEY